LRPHHNRFIVSKTPNRTNVVSVVLVVVVLVPVVEVLIPCVVRIVLRGTPVVIGSKASNTSYMKELGSQMGFHQRHIVTSAVNRISSHFYIYY
jgi:hypothetical protein